MKSAWGNGVLSIKSLPMDIGRLAYVCFRLFTRLKRSTVSGRKEELRIKGGGVLVANHCGFSDPFVVASAYLSRRVHIIAGIDVMPNAIVRELSKGMGCIMIDRSINDIESIKASIGVVKSGRLLAMFPQGGLVRNGEIDSVKSGAILIASQAEVPIIPIYIIHRKHWFSRCKIIVGERIVCTDYCARKFPTATEISTISEILLERLRLCKQKAVSQDNTYACDAFESNNV